MASINRFPRKLKNKIILRKESIAKVVLFLIFVFLIHYVLVYPFFEKWQQSHGVSLEDELAIKENPKEYKATIDSWGRNISAHIVLMGLHSKENWISGDQLTVMIILINGEGSAIIDPYFTLMFEYKDKNVSSSIPLPDVPAHDRIKIVTNKIQGIPETTGNCTIYFEINGTYAGGYDELYRVKLTEIDVQSPYCVEGKQWYRTLDVGMESIVYHDTLIIKNNCNESVSKLELSYLTPKKDIPLNLAVYKRGENQIDHLKNLYSEDIKETQPSCPFMWIKSNKREFIGETRRDISGESCILTATANLIDTIEPNETRFIDLEYSVSNLVQNAQESYPFDDLLIPQTLPTSVIAITNTGRKVPIYDVEDITMYIKLPRGYEFFNKSREITKRSSLEIGSDGLSFYWILENDELKWGWFDLDWRKITQMPRYDLLDDRPVLQFNGKIIFNSPNKIKLIVRRAPLHQIIFYVIVVLSSIFCCWKLWNHDRTEGPKMIEYFKTYQILVFFYLAQMIALPRPYAIGLFDYYMLVYVPIIFGLSYVLERISITDLIVIIYRSIQNDRSTKPTKVNLDKKYVSIAKSKIYHYPDCPYVKNRQDLIQFENKEAAEQDNRKFCKKCKNKNLNRA